jgi:hypothetical protein
MIMGTLKREPNMEAIMDGVLSYSFSSLKKDKNI